MAQRIGDSAAAPPLGVLFVTPELYPYVKTGGLGDVAAALPPALRGLGVDVRLLLPGLPAILDGIEDLQRLGTAPMLPAGDEAAQLLLGRTESGVPAYVVDAPALFRRPGNPYLGPDGRDWPDNHRRFGLLCRVAAAIGADGCQPARRPAERWRPDVVHGHDWQAGLVPAYLSLLAPRRRPGTLQTIHNLAFQGLFAASTLAELGLPPACFDMHGVEFWGRVGFLKAGLYFADAISTVSPSYAREIQTPADGAGLDGLLSGRRERLHGILNGIDESVWDPTGDPHVPVPFDAERLDDRAADRAQLRTELGLTADSRAPLLAVVSRLTHQKGLDLVLETLPRLVGEGGYLAVLGTGAAELEQGFRAAAAAHPGRIAVRIAYDEALSHRMMAGADAVLIPSRFEPCGLVQLYAQRYGALPVVTPVGGLKDTVTDISESSLADGSATGFVADKVSARGVARVIERALGLWQRPDLWRRVQHSAMAQHFGWAAPAQRYLEIYRSLVRKRPTGKPATARST